LTHLEQEVLLADCNAQKTESNDLWVLEKARKNESTNKKNNSTNKQRRTSLTSLTLSSTTTLTSGG
jgi:hypothetical protein